MAKRRDAEVDIFMDNICVYISQSADLIDYYNHVLMDIHADI